MNAVKKRESVRNPARVSHLKPARKRGGLSGASRPAAGQLSAAEIEADLQRICKGAPALDTQAVLNELRE